MDGGEDEGAVFGGSVIVPTPRVHLIINHASGDHHSLTKRVPD